MLGRILVVAVSAAIGGVTSLYASKRIDKGWKVPETVTLGGSTYDVPVIGGAEFDAGWLTAAFGVGLIAFGLPNAGIGVIAGTVGAQAPNVVASKRPELFEAKDAAALGTHGRRGLPRRAPVSQADVRAMLDNFAPVAKPTAA